jgi:hypothetical protein
MPENEWLECIPWNGTEADLPVGEIITIPNFRAMDLVRRWEVLDVEEDAGFREVKRSEIGPEDKIIGCQINEKSFDKIVATYGKRFFTAKRAVGGGQLDRWEWKAAYGSDVLELEALKQIRQGGEPFKIGGI